MYKLVIYKNEDKSIVCICTGTIDDVIFIVDNLKFQILYSFKISEV